MAERHPAPFESTDKLQQTCPRCGESLRDRTAVDQDNGLLFHRVRFACRACGCFCQLKTGSSAISVICRLSGCQSTPPKQGL